MSLNYLKLLWVVHDLVKNSMAVSHLQWLGPQAGFLEGPLNFDVLYISVPWRFPKVGLPPGQSSMFIGFHPFTDGFSIINGKSRILNPWNKPSILGDHLRKPPFHLPFSGSWSNLPPQQTGWRRTPNDEKNIFSS